VQPASIKTKCWSFDARFEFTLRIGYTWPQTSKSMQSSLVLDPKIVNNITSSTRIISGGSRVSPCCHNGPLLLRSVVTNPRELSAASLTLLRWTETPGPAGTLCKKTLNHFAAYVSLPKPPDTDDGLPKNARVHTTKKRTTSYRPYGVFCGVKQTSVDLKI
jgi:hypothetical protein